MTFSGGDGEGKTELKKKKSTSLCVINDNFFKWLWTKEPH